MTYANTAEQFSITRRAAPATARCGTDRLQLLAHTHFVFQLVNLGVESAFERGAGGTPAADRQQRATCAER